jgi:hypothetical protein
MAEKHPVNVSAGPPGRRLSSKERHAAQVAAIANEQSELKREAAERRAKRTAQSEAVGTKPA